MADFYKHDGKISRALEFYERATKVAPKKGRDRALIFREYGILLRDSGTPDALRDSTEALEIALKETPNDPVCTFVLGKVLCQRSMYLKARPLLERLLKSVDRTHRVNIYPLLQKCYEYAGDTFELSQLRGMAEKDGCRIR